MYEIYNWRLHTIKKHIIQFKGDLNRSSSKNMNIRMRIKPIIKEVIPIQLRFSTKL